MNDFWEQNKDFITKILSGAAVFLILSWIVLGLGAESDKERRERKGLMNRRSELLQQHLQEHGELPSGEDDDLDELY